MGDLCQSHGLLSQNTSTRDFCHVQQLVHRAPKGVNVAKCFGRHARALRLQLPAQQSNRRLELMGGVGKKPLLRMEGQLKSSQHLVESDHQGPDFGWQGFHRYAGGQVVLGDGVCCFAGQSDRPQYTAHPPVAQDSQHHNCQGRHDAHGFGHGRQDRFLRQLGKAIAATDLHPVVLSLNAVAHGGDMKRRSVDFRAQVVGVLLAQGYAGQQAVEVAV